MNKDKQIEEMARTMCNCYDSGYCKMHGNSCDLKCISGFNALGLYTADYRKDSEVARKIAEEILEMAECYGGGVLFWQRMKRFASDLKKERYGE